LIRLTCSAQLLRCQPARTRLSSDGSLAPAPEKGSDSGASYP
jgi:hypothetical protein